MTRLAGLMFSIVGMTLMGIAVVVALVLGHDTLWPILIAAAIGFTAGIPASWLVARRIVDVR